MIQGGKPTGDGDKEQSLWGPTFADEFDDRLKHSEAGVISMANAGPNTNKQQFFITFSSCPHLDRKHSVFGQVIDGMEILKSKMEKISTDRKDRPLETIKIVDTDILTNPAKDAEENEAQRIKERSEQRKSKQEKRTKISRGTADITKTKTATPNSSMIGKYLPKNVLQQQQQTQPEDDNEGDTAIPRLTLPQSKKANFQPKSTFGDFAGW
jgi:peptidyl-prolyl cis-trans isomerase-like protein 2